MIGGHLITLIIIRPQFYPIIGGCQQILGLEIWREDGSWASGWINTPTRIGMGDIVIEGDKVSLGEGMSAPLVGMGILYLTDT